MSYATLGSIFTVVVFVAFIGVVWWTFAVRSKKSFDEAANLVFDDESTEKTTNKNVGVNHQ